MNLDPHCICGEIDTHEHIYMCEILNTQQIYPPYIQIFSNNTSEQSQVYQVIEKCLEKRNDILKLFPDVQKRKPSPGDPSM